MVERPNTIILTPGLSGSSVLTGLLTRAGWWAGSETRKIQYETFENDDLVTLNQHILRESGYQWHDTLDLPGPSMEAVRELAEDLPPEPFRRFIEAAEQREPAIWKDPRLCYTIHFWGELLDLSRYRFIVMQRDPRHMWTGIVRKNLEMMSESQLRQIQRSCLGSARSFLADADVASIELQFEDLLLHPDDFIRRLNSFLGTTLTRTDLESVYHGPLGRLRRSGRAEYAVAKLRYGIEVLRGKAVRFPRSRQR